MIKPGLRFAWGLFWIVFTPHLSALELKGEVIQGGLLVGQTEAQAHIQFENRSIPVSSQGKFLIALGRDDEGTVTLTETLRSGQTTEKKLRIQKREYAIQSIQGLPPKKVNPPDSVMDRIHADSQKVRQARKLRENRTDWISGFIWPAKGPITGVYGSQRILNGVAKRPHFGVDVAAPVGTPVLAPAPGVITLAESDLYYSGGTIILDHGQGFSSSFLHLDSIDVELGKKVAQGERIATIGATGRVTGPHLDWRMNWFDKRIDPQLVLKALPPRKSP